MCYITMQETSNVHLSYYAIHLNFSYFINIQLIIWMENNTSMYKCMGNNRYVSISIY